MIVSYLHFLALDQPSTLYASLDIKHRADGTRITTNIVSSFFFNTESIKYMEIYFLLAF